MTKQPVWKFDKVEITYLQPVIKDGKKSKDRCLASIDFGFFHATDIGITYEFGTLTWSNQFGWSPFKFNLSQLENPYGKEVTKLAQMIKDEMSKKKDVIVDFLGDPSTAPKITRGEK